MSAKIVVGKQQQQQHQQEHCESKSASQFSCLQSEAPNLLLLTWHRTTYYASGHGATIRCSAIVYRLKKTITFDRQIFYSYSHFYFFPFLLSFFPFYFSFFDLSIITATIYIFFCRFGCHTLLAAFFLSLFASLVCVYVCVSAHYIFIHWPWQGANSWQLGKLRHYTICRTVSSLSASLSVPPPPPPLATGAKVLSWVGEWEWKSKLKFGLNFAVWHVQIDLAAIELAVSSDHHFHA